MAGYRVGVDIGGTFTDIVLLASDGQVHTRKVSSSVDDYARAIAEGLAGLFAELGLAGEQIAEVRHGTTVASNAILEHKGARTGLITTKGFRDVLEIRNLRMPRLYDIGWTKPPPLVERFLRVVVDERIDASGEVVRPLAPADAERAIRELLDKGVQAIAVCLLNCFANPAHERLIKAALERLAPDLPVSISSDVLPEIKEYERTSSTVINAYVMPIVARYLARLEADLAARGVRAPLLIMQSNGGLMSARAAAAKPMHIIESGPAGGVVGAQALARASATLNVITFDMGGTTAKAGVIEGGEFSRALEYQVGRRHHDRLAPFDRGRLSAQGAGDRPRRGRRRWRLDRAHRCRRLDGGRPRQRRRAARPGLLRPGRQRAHDHRCQPHPRLHQPRLSGWRRTEIERQPRALNVRGQDRRGARAQPRARRPWRPSDRQRQHDPGDPRGVDRAWPGSARLRAVRLRRQRPGVRLRDGAGARHAPGADPAGARPVFCDRPALRRGRAPLRAQLPPAAAPARPGGARPAPGKSSPPRRAASSPPMASRPARSASDARRACTTRARASI